MKDTSRCTSPINNDEITCVITRRHPIRSEDVINVEGIPVIVTDKGGNAAAHGVGCGDSHSNHDDDGTTVNQRRKNEQEIGDRGMVPSASELKLFRLERTRHKRRSSDNGSLPPAQTLPQAREPRRMKPLLEQVPLTHEVDTTLTARSNASRWGKSVLCVLALLVGTCSVYVLTPATGNEGRGSSQRQPIRKIQVFNDDNDLYPVDHIILPPRPIPQARRSPKNVVNVKNAHNKKIGSNISNESANDIDRETIIKGIHVTNSQEQYPYVVSLLQSNQRQKQAWHTCGGSMITPNIILTAAHCFGSTDIAHIGSSVAHHGRNLRDAEGKVSTEQEDDQEDDLLEIEIEDDLLEIDIDDVAKHDDESEISDELNSTSTARLLPAKIYDIRKYGKFGKAFRVYKRDKFIHPLYNPHTGDYDVMLIKLSGWNIGVPTINLNKNLNTPAFHEEASVLGWGVTQSSNSDSLSETLLRAPLQTTTNLECKQKYENLFGPWVIKDSMLCAQSKWGRDACKGDSGGPLIQEHPSDPSQDVIVGIVSWGEECGDSQYPGVYARVSEVQEWITSKVCEGLSPDSCSNGVIKDNFDSQSRQEKVCKDHVGVFPKSRYRSCASARRAKWWCYKKVFKEYCPSTCDAPC